jgi:hypothetical protein
LAAARQHFRPHIDRRRPPSPPPWTSYRRTGREGRRGDAGQAYHDELVGQPPRGCDRDARRHGVGNSCRPPRRVSSRPQHHRDGRSPRSLPRTATDRHGSRRGSGDPGRTSAHRGGVPRARRDRPAHRIGRLLEHDRAASPAPGGEPARRCHQPRHLIDRPRQPVRTLFTSMGFTEGPPLKPDRLVWTSVTSASCTGRARCWARRRSET